VGVCACADWLKTAVTANTTAIANAAIAARDVMFKGKVPDCCLPCMGLTSSPCDANEAMKGRTRMLEKRKVGSLIFRSHGATEADRKS
jgi:hypothetical protein